MRGLDRVERDIMLATEQLRNLKENQEYLQIQLAGIDPYNNDEEELSSRRRLEALKVQLVSLTNQFSEEYPDVKKARAEIAELEKILSEIEKQRKSNGIPPNNPAYISLAARLASVRTEIISNERKIEALNQQGNEFQQRIEATPKVEETYNSLIADRDNTKAKYNDMMQKIMDAQVAFGLDQDQKGERFTLVDPPRLPERPFKPNRYAILLISVVLGFGAGIALAALRETNDDAVRLFDQLEQATDLPVLAAIPVIVTDKDRLRKKLSAVALIGGSIFAVASALAIFHFLVMDLNIFWSKVIQRFGI
jgi:uncharacterized protein involved in exopolysaccharide biosynthesis